jgi:hypothetical protein
MFRQYFGENILEPPIRSFLKGVTAKFGSQLWLILLIYFYLGWTRMRKRLEPAIVDCRTRRLKPQREQVVLAVIEDYIKSAPPAQWSLLPPINDLRKTTPFDNLITAPHPNEITVDDCNDAVAQLPALCAHWLAEKNGCIHQAQGCV